MKAVFHVVCGLILFSVLWGCAMHAGSSPSDETTQTYQEALRRLKMGLDETQVRQLLGPPAGVNSINRWTDRLFSYFTTLHRRQRPATTEKRSAPPCFSRMGSW